MTGCYVILGSCGQLGQAWSALPGIRTLLVSRDDCDLSRDDFLPELEAKIGQTPVVAVINAAAYTRVDEAEGAGKEEAMRVNAAVPGVLAAWCRQRSIPFVHYSTDYVLDGLGDTPQTEEMRPHPLNVYGESKQLGEEAVIAAGGKYLIFRTSWVYDARGRNFFTTMLRLFKEKEQLAVVSDQIGAPTYAAHLAAGSHAALSAALAAPEFPSGLYHLCNSGETSWHGFAQAIFTLARHGDSGIRCRQIDPISSAEYPTPAKRPHNSRLDCSKAKRAFNLTLPQWEAGLRECFEESHADRGLSHCGIETHSA
jgi:dTDP-4-dehydrorhamnose reductase